MNVSAHAIRIHEFGGPEMMRWEEVQVPPPGPGEALIRQVAVGLNYIDVYQRTGLYKVPLPGSIGLEAEACVEAVGDGVTDLRVGQRVAYAGGPAGAYATRRTIPADRLVPVPDHIPEGQAAALMLQGMTAEYLLRRCYRVEPGDTILIHAAAGGVGLLVCQWAKHLGARVIGTVSSDEKAELARAHGCDHPIIYTRENFVERVRAITDGAMLPVVYDSIGKDTFPASLDALRPRGLWVTFGNASGPTGPIDPLLLSAKGSLYMTRPTLFGYTAKREELLASAAAVFAVVGSGAVKVSVNQTFPLAEAAAAHRALESRQTTGSTLLIP